jgi:hypothetical protein
MCLKHLGSQGIFGNFFEGVKILLGTGMVGEQEAAVVNVNRASIWGGVDFC